MFIKNKNLIKNCVTKKNENTKFKSRVTTSLKAVRYEIFKVGTLFNMIFTGCFCDYLKSILVFRFSLLVPDFRYLYILTRAS